MSSIVDRETARSRALQAEADRIVAISPHVLGYKIVGNGIAIFIVNKALLKQERLSLIKRITHQCFTSIHFLTGIFAQDVATASTRIDLHNGLHSGELPEGWQMATLVSDWKTKPSITRDMYLGRTEQ